MIPYFTSKTVLKYALSAVGPASVAVYHVMTKFNRWPDRSDAPFILAHMVAGVWLMHTSAPKDGPAVARAEAVSAKIRVQND